MSRNLLIFILILIIGTLLGVFIGKVILKIFPSDSMIREMLGLEIKPGLQPTTIDLGILEITLGAVVKLNITGVIGLIITVLIFRKLVL